MWLMSLKWIWCFGWRDSCMSLRIWKEGLDKIKTISKSKAKNSNITKKSMHLFSTKTRKNTWKSLKPDLLHFLTLITSQLMKVSLRSSTCSTVTIPLSKGDHPRWISSRLQKTWTNHSKQRKFIRNSISQESTFTRKNFQEWFNR